MSMSQSENEQADTTKSEPIGEDSRIAKFFEVGSNSAIDQVVAEFKKSRIDEVYTPFIKLKPAMLDSVHAAVCKITKQFFNDSFQSMMVDLELREKFKVLEKLDDKTDRKKKQKAWRPSGLSPEEQQRAHDLAHKEAAVATLREMVAAKEKRVRELQVQATAARLPTTHLENQVGHLLSSAAEEYETCHANAEHITNNLDES